MNQSRKIIESILEGTGIVINGESPHDPQIHNEAFFDRVLRFGSLGLGESYMDKWWDCDRLDEFFNKIFLAELDKKIKGNWEIMLGLIWQSIMNLGMRSKSFEVGEKHYDIGNDLYSAMLDKRLTYTCGYWENAANLDEAQEAKLDLICKKINLQKGQKILDIGSGWGSFIGFAAEKYGAEAVGVTVSKEQKKLADEKYKGLTASTVLQDYRDIKGSFDHVVSLGMFEHVGYKNYRTFMQVVQRALKKDGLFLLHTIGSNHSVKTTDPWISKYIFPNSMLPSIAQIAKAAEGLFVMEDWHNFSVDYDKTLLAWFANFDHHWPVLKDKYSERFYRMWKFYLLSCAGSFRSRHNQLWQIVFSKRGIVGGYHSIR